MELLRMDKKRNENLMDYILLDRPGKASVHSLPFEVIENALSAYESEN
jgi:3-dehydroquinate synthetase